MPETTVLHTVERDLAHHDRIERHPLGLATRRPPALSAGRARVLAEPRTALAQEVHTTVLHAWCELIDEGLVGDV